MMTIKRLVFLFGAVGLLAGCITKPAAPAAAAPQAPVPAVEAAAETPDPPAGPASASAQQQAQKLAQAAVDSLEAGNEEQARAELLRALVSDPNNKLAHNLQRQMTVDPVSALGRESFPYVVKPGETLSRIAQRHLGDLYSFYILARYNDIKVPRQLSGGQTIRIPGKAPAEPKRAEAPASPRPAPVEAGTVAGTAPLPVAVTPPPPVAVPEASPGERAVRAAETAERAGDLDRALAEYRRAGDHPGAAAKAEQLRKLLVARHTVGARTAFAKQDLDGTIGQWDRVLDLDPANETAKLERKKALGLKEKLKSVK